jgi:glucose-6-phosphate dehydrogenase assembly protein OpcA
LAASSVFEQAASRVAAASAASRVFVAAIIISMRTRGAAREARCPSQVQHRQLCAVA